MAKIGKGRLPSNLLVVLLVKRPAVIYVAAALVVGFTVLSGTVQNHLEVTPDAQREIEGAKGR
jgi:hypothetical protein